MTTDNSDITAGPKSRKAKAREGKVAIVGYFSPELSIRLNVIKAQERKTTQALLGEAIDLLLIQHGQSPAGER